MKFFGGLLAAAGFFILFVAGSTSDYETSGSFRGAPHPFWELAAAGVFGLALFVGGLRLAKRRDGG